jgi:hypothetical protein
MLLPDNIQPEFSIYYNGALVLKELKNKDKQPIIELYQKIRESDNMSFPTFILCLDWLYLVDLATINKEGYVELCL